MSESFLDRLGWTRRDFMTWALNAVALCTVSSFCSCSEKNPLRVAVHPWAGYQFIFLAQQEGLLPAKGLELVETAILSESAAALAQGRVDAAALTLDEVLGLRDRGTDVQVVLVFDVSAGADALLAVPEIETIRDLKGRRIGVEKSTLGTVMLCEILKAAGLERQDVQVIPMAENHFDAWQKKPMDALVTYEPYLSMLEKDCRLHRIFDSRSLPQLILDVLAVHPEAAKRHVSALRKLIAGHFDALHLWRTNPIDTTYRLAQRLKLSPEDIQNLFKGLDLPDVFYNRKYLSAPANDMDRSTLELANIMQQAGLLKNPPNLDHLFLSDYLPEDAP